MISKIFHLDNELNDLGKIEREKRRKRIVKPKVDDFFAWAKDVLPTASAGGATYKRLQYCINQEPFLRAFLSDGNVPMDNNLAEQAIRPFTLRRKNWVNINTIQEAESSAILYSIVETAKANNLRVHDYVKLLLTELSAHADDTNRDFIQDLLPWSKNILGKMSFTQKISIQISRFKSMGSHCVSGFFYCRVLMFEYLRFHHMHQTTFYLAFNKRAQCINIVFKDF